MDGVQERGVLAQRGIIQRAADFGARPRSSNIGRLLSRPWGL
ncbi:MAG TPA: hypothetical protein PLC79_09955 [Phycisphaerae bacterium]|nr:hypothetical protein [Phycisphaerae bacterium]